MCLAPFYCKEIYFVAGKVVQVCMCTLWNSYVSKVIKKRPFAH